MESLRPRRLTEFLEILWRRKRLLLLMALVMLIATLIVIRRIPNIYESRALIVVNLRSDQESLAETARFSRLQQELVSHNTLVNLVRKYSLYPNVNEMEEATQMLQKSLKIETRMRSYSAQVPESVLISHRYSDPKTAQAVITDLVRMFEQGNERIKVEAAAEAGRLAAQIAEVEARLKEIGPKLDPHALRLDALSQSRNDSTPSFNQRQILESSIETLSDDEYSLQRRIAEQRNLIAEYEKTVKSLPATPGSAAYGALLAEKSKIEAEISNYADQYTDKHPKMIQLRNQLAEINRQITRLETQTGTALPLELTPEGRELLALKRELRRMEADLDLAQRRLQRKNQQISGIPPVSTQPTPDRSLSGAPVDNVARTEYDRLVIRYSWLLDKHDSMLKLSGAQGPAHMLFYVIDAPSLPRLPVAPNRLILQLVALGMAIVFGLFIALAVEIPRMFTINDDRDIQYYLGAPVLALIPETLTPIERARRRKLRMTRGLLVLTLAVALTPILALLLTYLPILQAIGAK